MSVPPTCPACGGPFEGCRTTRRTFGVVACGLTALAILALFAILFSRGLPDNGPPAGWSEVCAADAGFRSCFPGELHRGVAGFPDARGQTQRFYSSLALDEPTVQVFVHDPPAGEAVPTTPEQLDAAAPEFLRSLQANRNWRVIDKVRVVQSGRPALEVRAKTAWVGHAATPPPTVRTGVADASVDGPPPEWWPSWVVYRIVPHGRRLYVVWVEQQGRQPDPKVLNTVWTSFIIC
jgi:hypothetical protein